MKAIWNLVKGTGLLYFSIEYKVQRACLKAYVHRGRKGSNPNIILFYSDTIKVFTSTDAQVFFKRNIKIYIKTAPTCFGVITIIRERTI